MPQLSYRLSVPFILPAPPLQTPDRQRKCSKRAWDGEVRVWRRAIHQWDPRPAGEAVAEEEAEAAEL
jgi:hypothetical protein